MNIIKTIQAHQWAPTHVHENDIISIRAKAQTTGRAVTGPFLSLGKEVEKNVQK